MSELYRPPIGPVGSSEEPEGKPSTVTVDTRTGEIIEDQPQTLGPSQGVEFIGRLSSLYLICRTGHSLFIVDQHTAHERVLYEETMLKIDEHSVHGQNLLFPVQVELSPEQFALFEENQETFSTGGFEVTAFGGRTVNIQAVPAVLGRKSPEKVFSKIIDDIVELRSEGYDVKKAMAQSIACRAAVMSGDRLTDQESTHLLERLLKCENPYSCPHGRPTFLRISKDDLDRKFGRA
jgi:DNA mismatch repair protein MutL